MSLSLDLCQLWSINTLWHLWPYLPGWFCQTMTCQVLVKITGTLLIPRLPWNNCCLWVQLAMFCICFPWKLTVWLDPQLSRKRSVSWCWRDLSLTQPWFTLKWLHKASLWLIMAENCSLENIIIPMPFHFVELILKIEDGPSSNLKVKPVKGKESL